MVAVDVIDITDIFSVPFRTASQMNEVFELKKKTRKTALNE